VLAIGSVEQLVHEQYATTTPTGRPTIKRHTKTDRNRLYAELLGSQVLATVKEALAVCPSLTAVTLLAVANEDREVLTPLYCGSFSRDWYRSADWANLHPFWALTDAAESLINVRGRTEQLHPLALGNEPEVAAVVEQIAAGLGKTVNPACLPARRGSR